MKKLFVWCIRAYQAFSRSLAAQRVPPFSLSGCRSWPTCSEYTIAAIERGGVICGSIKGIIRVAHCNPFTSPFRA